MRPNVITSPAEARAFGEDYYERGVSLGISGYENYRWLPEATLTLAHELVTQLGVQKTDRILDFGCAKGFLVKALRLLHYDATGYDTSEYALSQAPEDVRPHLANDLPRGPFDLVIAKDVFEHLEPEQLVDVLGALRERTRKLFVVVPLGDGQGSYVVPEYEQDVTHVIRESMRWWVQTFVRTGYVIHRGTKHMRHVKQDWQDRYPEGNGFFTLWVPK